MKINSDDAVNTLGLPSGFLLSGDHIYELRSYTDIGTAITSFNQAITVIIEYEDSGFVRYK